LPTRAPDLSAPRQAPHLAVEVAAPDSELDISAELDVALEGSADLALSGCGWARTTSKGLRRSRARPTRSGIMGHPSEQRYRPWLADSLARRARPGEEPDPVALTRRRRARRTVEKVLHEKAHGVREAAVMRAIDPVPDARQEQLPGLRAFACDGAGETQ
jgi:hypothetical protein